ncbi:hypothetical protein KDA_25640 [Dictyobacter alpinus]|uniref:RNA polymerase sigma factor n=1 Tax=Dictyobacter alpinus TaxID=2014873 RepID=A0A402B6Z1_9CHLR|nr:RNA polymerase sigma factor [Dictyobacter alpinus]GCE27080.1 hypothetical protein KDA_25640 [Dictyobacter alpinus]
MFNLLVIAGILLIPNVDISSKNIRAREKVYPGMTVEKSVNQSQPGNTSDEAALIQLYEQFRRPIHSYIYRLLGSQEDADDVTQEVFMRVFTSWNGLYERDNLSAWLYRIATNLCVDILRKRKRISWWSLGTRSRQDDPYSDNASQEDFTFFLADNGGIPEIAERELIRQTLSNLPEEYAAVLILSAAQGVPYQEIATIVGISPNAAATRISRAKKMFAKQYQRISKDGVGKRSSK